jgi:hypothetical protein
MIQMGALDDPPAHATRSLSSALTEGGHNVPNIKATPRKAAYNLRCIFLAVFGAFTGGGCILA